MSRKITFPVTAPGVRTNHETGVEIHTLGSGEYQVVSPSRMDMYGDRSLALTLNDARRVAQAAARWMRDAIASAFLEALGEDAARRDPRALSQSRRWTAVTRLRRRKDVIEALHVEALADDRARDAALSVVRDAKRDGPRPRYAEYMRALNFRGDRWRMNIAGQHRAALDVLHAVALHEDVRAVVAPQLHPVPMERPRWAASLDLGADQYRTSDKVLVAMLENGAPLGLLRRLADAEVRALKAEAALIALRARLVLSA